MTGSGAAGELTMVDVRKGLDALATHLDTLRESAVGGAETEATRRAATGADNDDRDSS